MKKFMNMSTMKNMLTRRSMMNQPTSPSLTKQTWSEHREAHGTRTGGLA